MFKTITWNTALAAERWRFNLKLNKKRRPRPKASSLKPQATSFKRHEKDTIKRYSEVRKMKVKKYWLLDYFIRPHSELAPSYIKKVEKFLKCLKKKQDK